MYKDETIVHLVKKNIRIKGRPKCLNIKNLQDWGILDLQGL